MITHLAPEFIREAFRLWPKATNIRHYADGWTADTSLAERPGMSIVYQRDGTSYTLPYDRHDADGEGPPIEILDARGWSVT